MMSTYRNYVPWAKGTPSSVGTKREPATISKFESSNLGRTTRTDANKKDDESKGQFRSGVTKYGNNSSYNNAGFQRSLSATRDTGTYSSRNKVLDKKDVIHPPVSYRSLSKTGASSRDPSPVSKSEKSSSTSSYGYNKLYPSTYTGSTPRERTESTSSSHSTIPKYSGRSSLSKDDIPKIGRNTSEFKDENPRYKSVSRTTSREDLSSGPQKYISSRFLPKNTVEKSFTAYSRPSTIRANETSRKNRELLNVLHVQNEHEKVSRPSSSLDYRKHEICKTSSQVASEGNIEMESVIVISRSTSPSPITLSHNSGNLLRSRRIDVARLTESKIMRPKICNKKLTDKGIQSDRLDDSTKSSKFSGASRISATPWTSILDMKFSSPKNLKNAFNRPNKDLSRTEPSVSDKVTKEPAKSLSRSGSTKGTKHTCVPEENLPKPNKIASKKLSPSKQSPTSSEKKLLPPQIPTRDSSHKSATLHSLANPQNKDFRKSVLNMNPDSSRKVSRRSNSLSSAESESEIQNNSEATDVSENLASCRSFHNSNSLVSRLPQRISSDKLSSESRRSPSSDVSLSSSATASNSEEDNHLKADKVSKSTNSSRTSVITSALEELSLDKSPKPPVSPLKQKIQNAEAKSFLMRALAPVTNFFKVKPHDSSENSEWLNDTSELHSEDVYSEFRPIRKFDSTEMEWWDDDSLSKTGNKSSVSKSVSRSTNGPTTSNINQMDSEETPWWLDESAEIPEGVLTYPNYVREDGTTEDGRVIYKLRRNDSGKLQWWLESSEACQENQKSLDTTCLDSDRQLHKIRHIDSGERAWWLCSSENISEMVDRQESNHKKIEDLNYLKDSSEHLRWVDDNENSDNELEAPLGDRASPEGLEMPKGEEGRLSPYDNVPNIKYRSGRPQNLFISRHTNIDDILGGSGQMWSPLLEQIFHYQQVNYEEAKMDINSNQLGKKDNTPIGSAFHPSKMDKIACFAGPILEQEKLDDAALQLYKDGDYGSYLDLDASISEQQEEFEGFQSNKKNSIVLRTQLSVRVHTIIEKLLTSEGRELRRALFSLKQIFQEDKDLVHEFVQNDGLSCLIKVGSEADQNYQNYILRALGQVMLYVDGMNGVMDHNPTVQWLYSLISSKFRLVVKTALKLLLVFVEYVDSNCLLLVKAVQTVDLTQGLLPWHNIMKLLKDFDAADTELLIYAMTLINKVLNAVPNQDIYFDQTDALEEQDIEHIIQRYMSKPGTDLDLLQQFQIYEAVLQYEDGEDSSGNPMRILDESIRKTLRNRKSISDSAERRKSRRHSTGNYTSVLQQRLANGNILNRNSSRKSLTPLLNAVNKLDSEDSLTKQPWILSMMYNKSVENQELENLDDTEVANENERNLMLQLKRENTVKDLTQKLANQNILHSPSDESKINRIGDMSGLISKAKEGLAKSKSKADLKAPTSEGIPKIETKKSENELKWEELISNLNRSLNLCDMDFTDLHSDDEQDVLAPVHVSNGIPPPPPPLFKENGVAPPPPPLSSRIPPLVPNPPVFGIHLQRSNRSETKIPVKKSKKTVKLFWKEVRDDAITAVKLKTGNIWDELSAVSVDTQKLEHLFESRAKDLLTKKQQEMNKNKEIIVLDPKRSNAINIGMTKLPPPRSIKTAILKMDATIMNREGIEKLLTMLPTEEERTKIQEAQSTNPDLPLGSAEQFLLTLASISELPARLKLWAFKLDFENTEREIAEPLMDLKQGIEVLRINKTFRGILSTLLSIGNFLNGNEVKGFQIEYLAKVPEVKDTVHKHSLLHHLCHIVMEKFSDATDLYSEIGSITRASKIDFDELTLNIHRLEDDCKASWDHLKLIAKHDGSTMMKVKMSDFLTDCAERIILLGIVHRRIMNRFSKFLLWLGIPIHQISDTKPNEFCRIISEFALEYRTTRERVLQQLEKKANHRERNKTRGKMITEVGKFRSKEDRADAELRQLLGSDMSDVESFQGTLPLRRTRKDANRSFIGSVNGHLTDGDDEILESLVKTATKVPSRTAPRERKRTRHADRKSFKRSRTRENNPYGAPDSP